MEIKLDIQLVWCSQRSSTNAALLCSVFCLLQMPLLPVSWLNVSLFSFWIFLYVQNKTIIPIYFNIFDSMLLTTEQRYWQLHVKNENREECEHKLPLPQNMQGRFLNLEKLWGTAHHGVWRMSLTLGKAPSWARCPLANMAHQLWKRHGLGDRLNPETCPAPEDVSFPCILKSYSSLTLTA